MKLLKFLKDRLRVRGKIIFGAIGVAFLLFLGSAHYTYADMFGIGSIGYTVFSAAAMAIAYILAWIFGVIISIEAWLIGVVLNINAGILQTSLVQTGFSISLSVANLAFVLGIIVIALATILRIENYSIKKMLWKLVVMAILVNFGLVIIAPIFAFGNATTQYFLNCINPNSGGCAQSTSGISSFNTFATTMVSKFNPGALLNAPQLSGGNSNALGATSGPFTVTGNGDLAPIGAMMIPIFSLVFTIIDFVLIVFVLGAFIIMLMIRYVYIALLAILLPFAWASWVFPSFSSMYSRWWNKFLQWTFFAPIFMFFLYLALTTIGGTNNADVFNTNYAAGSGNTLFTALLNFFGAGIGPILANFMQEILIGGLILGGMIAADSMGVKFAGSAMKTAQNVGKGIQGYVGKQSKKAGRAAFRGVGGERAVNAMRSSNVGLGVVGRIPLVGAGAKWAVNRGASVAGRAIAPHLGNSDLVDAAKKNVPENPATIKESLKGNMNTEDNFAHLSKLIEKGELDEDTMVGNQKASAWMDSHEKDVANYGFGKSAKDADKVLGSNKAMRSAAAGLTPADMKDPNNQQAQELRNATNEFVGSLKADDVSKLNVNKVFDSSNAGSLIQSALARSFATDGPGDAAKAISKMSSATKTHFKKIYEEQIEDAKKQSANLTAEQKTNIKSASDYFKKSMEANATYGAAEVAATPTPTPAPVPTP